MSNNKTIAKNTLFLYFRMLLVMGVSLYTSRIVLKELGISDYGVYSLVGGFISLFGFLNAAMSSATQRYLTFDIGKNDPQRLKKTFSSTLTIHVGIALLVLVLAETIGLWYVNNKMIFPSERTYAVNFVYQFSIAVALLGIIQVPYNALIIARERMSIYAYVSIVEVLLKLIIVFLLVYIGNDKLITYSILTFVVALGIRLFYQYYCRKHYIESHFKFEWDKDYYKELMSYSGWSLFGNLANVGKAQGVNILLNLFYGTVVNSAYGLTMQVQGAVHSFVTNFQMAVKPQIIQNYARNDFEKFEKLIFQSSRLSFFLLYIISMPVIYNIDYLLSIWLVEVPAYTSTFIIFSIIGVMIDCIAEPLITGIHASGKIKRYQIFLSAILLFSLPASYILLKKGFSPEIVFIVLIILNIISLFYRLISCHILTNLTISFFFKNVVLRIIVCLIPSLIFLYIFHLSISISNNFIQFGIESIGIIVVNVILVYFIGITKNERTGIQQLILNKLK